MTVDRLRSLPVGERPEIRYNSGAGFVMYAGWPSTADSDGWPNIPFSVKQRR